MTDHKFTDDEIIELLNAYVERTCGKCNVKDLGICCGTCFITAISQAADLINRQKAQIESLNAVHADMTESLRLAAEANKDMQAEIEAQEEEYADLLGQRNAVEMMLDISRAEAIKEFAKKLKAETIETDRWGKIVLISDINTLVKEMTETK